MNNEARARRKGVRYIDTKPKDTSLVDLVSVDLRTTDYNGETCTYRTRRRDRYKSWLVDGVVIYEAWRKESMLSMVQDLVENLASYMPILKKLLDQEVGSYKYQLRSRTLFEDLLETYQRIDSLMESTYELEFFKKWISEVTNHTYCGGYTASLSIGATPHVRYIINTRATMVDTMMVLTNLHSHITKHNGITRSAL